MVIDGCCQGRCRCELPSRWRSVVGEGGGGGGEVEGGGVGGWDSNRLWRRRVVGVVKVGVTAPVRASWRWLQAVGVGAQVEAVLWWLEAGTAVG